MSWGYMSWGISVQGVSDQGVCVLGVSFRGVHVRGGGGGGSVLSPGYHCGSIKTLVKMKCISRTNEQSWFYCAVWQLIKIKHDEKGGK